MFKIGDLVIFKDTEDNRQDTYLKAGGVYEIKDIGDDLIKVGNNIWRAKHRFIKPILTPIKNNEAVNHPNHYNQGIEVIDIIESWGLNFSLGNAIKYILRAPHKGKELEDLKKASWYVNREIERLEKLAKG